MARNVVVNQPSFAGGELSPSLRARVDLAKYRVGLALCRNFFILPGGGCASRPGFQAILRSKQSAINAVKPRLIPFSFSTTQTYIIEFGHLYIRVIYNGGYALEAGQSVTSVTKGATTVINKVAHGYSDGEWIYFYSVTGMVELNSSPGFVGVVTGAAGNSFTINDIDGNSVDSTAWAAFIAGTMARVYTLVSPYDEDDLPLIKFAQNADTMTITHPSYAPRYLTRSSHVSWSFTTVTFAPTVQPPTGVTLARTNAGAFYKQYAVASVADSGEESVPSATVDTTAAPTAALNQDTGVGIRITWTAPASGGTPDFYNIYASRQWHQVLGAGGNADVLGYIGSSETLAFTDTNIEPDFSLRPVATADITSTYGNFGCNAYFQGRQFFAATTNYPQVVAASAAGNFKNFNEHQIIRDDDPFIIQLLANQVNAIKHLVSLNSLVALTGDGAWILAGDRQDEAITALSVRALPQQYNGCSDVPPLNVSSDILYCQDRGAKVRTLAYQDTTNLFTGVDITVLASHLFTGREILETAYCEEPYSLVYAVMSDGAMNVMTYLKEQDIYAWARWTSPGSNASDAFVSVASIAEGNQHVAYVVTRRSASGVKGGNYYYMIERLSTRQWIGSDGLIDPDLVFALDSAIEQDGASTTTVRGLHHLIGANVEVYADGGKQNSKIVAADGTITLDTAASRIVAGLAYTPQMQTLRLEVGDGSIQGKRKKVSRLSMIVNEARGLKAAQMRDDLEGNSIVGQLYEMKERSSAQTMSSALPFFSGVRSMILQGGYQVDGSVFIQGTPGLPCEVLAVIPTITVGDDDG